MFKYICILLCISLICGAALAEKSKTTISISHGSPYESEFAPILFTLSLSGDAKFQALLVNKKESTHRKIKVWGSMESMDPKEVGLALEIISEDIDWQQIETCFQENFLVGSKIARIDRDAKILFLSDEFIGNKHKYLISEGKSSYAELYYHHIDKEYAEKVVAINRMKNNPLGNNSFERILRAQNAMTKFETATLIQKSKELRSKAEHLSNNVKELCRINQELIKVSSDLIRMAHQVMRSQEGNHSLEKIHSMDEQ